MHRHVITSALLLAASITLAATPADDIKYRKAVMTSMSGHVSAAALIVSGKVEHQDLLSGHAEALAGLGDQVGKLFPAGSGTGKTEALPLIWQEPEKFQKAADAVKVATAGLRDAVKSGDQAAISKALKPVFDSCKGCHDRYRKEEETKN